jgi:hypothetical protein
MAKGDGSIGCEDGVSFGTGPVCTCAGASVLAAEQGKRSAGQPLRKKKGVGPGLNPRLAEEPNTTLFSCGEEV